MKILNIEQVQDIKLSSESYSSYDGYRIKTDKKEYQVLIDNGQSCCERWGAICSSDNLQDFIGAEIISDARCVEEGSWSDCDVFKKVYEDEEYLDCFDCAFVDFKTDKGNLQFAVYNSHNGYYGHDIIIVTKDI